MLNKLTCYCVICGKYIGRYFPSVTRKVCSKRCKGKLYGQNHSGINNPNYKHGKTIENRCVICNQIIDYRATNCHSCSKKGTKNFFYGKTHTLETKKIIGQKSKEKFTPEYLNRVRKTNEKRGVWVPNDKLSKYTMYYRKCEWDKEVSKAPNFNTTRHHLFSRFDGFVNNINPLIIKHPANCKRIKRIKNISIGNKSQITKMELYNRIRKYKGNWSKHKECLGLLGVR